MKVSRVDFAFGGKRATFYFTAEGRVDFRQLVRDLPRRFSARVQDGPGRGARRSGPDRRHRHLRPHPLLLDLAQGLPPISIQMAKRQNLSLNPSKISGQCGRLLCCLAYEDDQYRKARKPAPARGGSLTGEGRTDDDGPES
jgi:cell fate regulator YaaT (PSP1 superfamily)